MNRRPRAHALWLLLLLTACSPLLAEQWTEVRSPNFNVITDAGEKRGRDAALRFEQIRAAFSVIFQKAKVNTPIPVQVIAFRNNKELRRFAPLWKGKPVEVAGFYVPGEDRQFITVDLSSESGWEVVFHEYSHLLLHANLPPIPVWFDEGFAEYFASLKIENGRIRVGNVLEGRSYALSNTRWMRIQDLFAIQHDSSEYNERGDHRTILYAESWLVVHYLESRNKMKQATDYLNLVENQHLPIADAVQRAFGMPPAQFDKDLRDYYNGRGRLLDAPAPSLPSEQTYTSRPISDADAEAILGDLHLHEIDYTDQAVGEFQQVLQQQPDNAIAHRGLGYALLRKGDYTQAEQHLKLAIANTAGGADARTHYLYALLLTRKAAADPQAARIDLSQGSPDLPTLKKETQAAIALDPEFADAYNLLAFAQAREGDYQAALTSETKAFQLNPHNDAYVLNLAQYYAGLRNWNESERLLKSLLNSSNAMVVQNARDNLENVANARRFEAAEKQEAAQQSRIENPSTGQPFRGSDVSSVNVQTPAMSQAPSPSAAIQFLKGKIVKVDCSTSPGATVGVFSGNKLWAMTTPNRSKTILIGADVFSCDWRDRSVSVNFRNIGNYVGEIVSLELE